MYLLIQQLVKTTFLFPRSEHEAYSGVLVPRLVFTMQRLLLPSANAFHVPLDISQEFIKRLLRYKRIT
jgi:hypothetical protein